MTGETDNDTLSQIVDEMYDAANTSTLEHLDAAKIALRGFADRLSELEAGRFAVVYVNYGDTCDGFPGVLGVYGTLADAVKNMRADVRSREATNPGFYPRTKHTAVTSELWYDTAKTIGCTWKVVEI